MLIELIIFIVITGILASTILLGLNATLSNTSNILQQTIAAETAQQCMEWFLGQRRLNGYTSITCNSTTPTFCTAPAGYTVSTACVANPINGDANYESLTVTVSGLSSASLKLLIGNY